MFKIAVVIFRECLEIALLLGIIMAVTQPIRNSKAYILMGTMVGVTLASLFAIFTRTITISFGGLGDEIFDACVILFTVVVISWTIIWMQGYSKRIKQDFNELSEKITSGAASKLMLVIVVATTILREGIEILLFVYSISSAERIDIHNYVVGLGIGALSGFLVGAIIYLGLIRLSVKYIFKVSTILLILIAAGLASEAAGILTSSGVIETMSDQVWDSSWLIQDRSLTGKLLNIIIGYNSRPNGMQIIFYLATIIFNIFNIYMLQIKAKRIEFKSRQYG